MSNSECESRAVPCRCGVVGALSSEFERGLQLPASASELERPMSNLVMDASNCPDETAAALLKRFCASRRRAAGEDETEDDEVDREIVLTGEDRGMVVVPLGRRIFEAK